MTTRTVRRPAVRIRQRSKQLVLTMLTAGELVKISYVAQRGVSQERGAVQRLLNRTRISGISVFALAGGDFPNSIVLNWTSTTHNIRVHGNTVRVPLAQASAQLIDGQHRVEGFREAIKRDSKFGSVEIPVAIYSYLSTQQCADIFLSINTEQKPVPRNLVVDLYGVASEHVRDDPTIDAKRLVDGLNTEAGSPYFGLVRYPGPKQRKGGIALSSMVGVLKPLVVSKGTFDQVGLLAYEDRLATLINWFSVLRDAYGSQWSDKDNVFRYASGFWGAVEFFANKMLRYCHLKDAFDKHTMATAMKDLSTDLIWQQDVAGLQGRKAASVIADLLSEYFSEGRLERKRIRV